MTQEIETEVKQKLAFVKQKECDRLIAMADYIYATCKAIACDKDRSNEEKNFIIDLYYRTLEINGDH